MTSQQALRLCVFASGFAVLTMALSAAERPPLLDAAKNDARDVIRSLVAKHADVNAAEADGTTALHWAAYHNDVDGADLLIRAGAKVNATNDLGVTALWNAAQNGSEAMVARLLAAGANPNLALQSGETPLMIASRTGYPAVAEQLIAKGADLNAHGTRGQTALMWAVSQKHPEVVKVLIAHGVDLHAKSDVWNEMMAVPPHGYLPYNRLIPHGGDTALMFAARNDDLDSAKLLVAAGANVNDKDGWGISATALAAFSGHRDIVMYLLDKGADPNVPADFTALQCAIMRRDAQMVAALLDHGADPNTRVKNWTPTRRSSKDDNFGPELVGATPFWLAAKFQEPEIMRLLLKHGADAKAEHQAEYVTGGLYKPRKEVTNALMAAAGLGQGDAWESVPRAQREAKALEAVKLCVELGFDVNATATDGRNALDGAIASKFQTVADFLTANGAKATGVKVPTARREEI